MGVRRWVGYLVGVIVGVGLAWWVAPGRSESAVWLFWVALAAALVCAVGLATALIDGDPNRDRHDRHNV